MIFNKHSALAGAHAQLSASKYHWINYDEEKFRAYYASALAAQKGTELHALAHFLIRVGQKLPQSQRTLNMYVNDAIGYRMSPEQTLFYSENCFGTPDAISFSEKKMVLRISDLKTGVSPASVKQLLVYAAMFHLEYGIPDGFRPMDTTTELRIYQSDEIQLYLADPIDIMAIMDKIITFDRWIREMREEAQ